MPTDIPVRPCGTLYVVERFCDVCGGTYTSAMAFPDQDPRAAKTCQGCRRLSMKCSGPEWESHVAVCALARN